MSSSDFTKRAGLDKQKGFSKLVMLCGREYTYRMLYLTKNHTQELAWYYFMYCFESSGICGESGAHLNVVDMEIAKKPGYGGMWAISVTLNISLDAYRRKRKRKKFAKRLRERSQPQRSPSFREIKPEVKP